MRWLLSYRGHIALGIVGLACLSAAAYLAHLDWPVPFFACFGAAIVLLGATFIHRCPACGTSLALTAKERSRAGAVRRCSRCGHDLMSPAPEEM